MKSFGWNHRFAMVIFHTVKNWLAQVDSNHRPRAYQARALTTWAMSQYFSVRPVGGGDDGIRTHDPLLAGQVLSQLSYTPICASQTKSASQVKSLRGEIAPRWNFAAQSLGLPIIFS